MKIHVSMLAVLLLIGLPSYAQAVSEPAIWYTRYTHLLWILSLIAGCVAIVSALIYLEKRA